MSKKIVISGWYGFGNIGDEAILQAMIDTFEKEYPNCQITVLSYKLEYTKKVQQVEAVYQIPIHGIKTWIKNIVLLRWIPTLKAIKDCDIFIMGGGGFLSDWQPEVPKGWLKQMKIAKFFGKKTILYGIGAGPFLTERGKKQTKYYIDNFVDEVTVRDKTSLKNLEQLNLKTKILLTNDPVMDLKINNCNKIKRKKSIGINFVELFKFRSFSANNEKFDKYIFALKEIIKYLQEEYPEYNLEFVSFFKKDTEFYETYFEESNIHIIEPKDYKELVQLMCVYKIFIGTRFHSIIFSIKTNTPTLAIVYQHKCLDLCQQYNIQYEIVSDGNLPPLKNIDINLEKLKIHIDNFLKGEK